MHRSAPFWMSPSPARTMTGSPRAGLGRELLAALGAATGEHPPATRGRRARAKAVAALADQPARLKGSLHVLLSVMLGTAAPTATVELGAFRNWPVPGNPGAYRVRPGPSQTTCGRPSASGVNFLLSAKKFMPAVPAMWCQARPGRSMAPPATATQARPRPADRSNLSQSYCAIIAHDCDSSMECFERHLNNIRRSCCSISRSKISNHVADRSHCEGHYP